MDFVLIGIGYWGKNYYRILNSNDNINLTAVVDNAPYDKLDSNIQYFQNIY